MGLDDRGGGEASILKAAVQLLDMLWLRAVEPMVPDAADKLVGNELPIADQSRRAHLARGDGVQPVLEPLPDGRCLPCRTCRPASRFRSRSRTFATTSPRFMPETCRRSRRPFSLRTRCETSSQGAIPGHRRTSMNATSWPPRWHQSFSADLLSDAVALIQSAPEIASRASGGVLEMRVEVEAGSGKKVQSKQFLKYPCARKRAPPEGSRGALCRWRSGRWLPNPGRRCRSRVAVDLADAGQVATGAR
jgi:hypothetical protein